MLQKLKQRKDENLYRKLTENSKSLIDFCSNDYLGFAYKLNDHSTNIERSAGSTGSRLISGNSSLAVNLEKQISKYHSSESALIFNSGYDANLGLLSCVPQRGDFIFYDELSHASIIDGIGLSYAKPIKFKHNDLIDLTKKINLQDIKNKSVFIVAESVYSMDGDLAPLRQLSELCKNFNFHLIIDEAHSAGVFGEKGEGLCVLENIHENCFARIITFGKAFGLHGAAILGSETLRDFLINFSRPFIYSTALPPHSFRRIEKSYKLMQFESETERKKLHSNISIFNEVFSKFPGYKNTPSAIQTIIIQGNKEVSEASCFLANAGFDVRAIKSPTVEAGQERLRVCLHSFNTAKEINNLFLALSEWQEKK